MDQLAVSWGILPFFKGIIPGFSIEERVSPELWFSNEHEGPWDWKGLVIREGHCAYGKFFGKKACYINLDLFPDFINYRRSKPVHRTEDQQTIDEIVYETIRVNGEITIKELRSYLDFAQRRGKKTKEEDRKSGKLPIEPIIERLMMSARVVIADFDYSLDKHGRTYGWGVARYTTPEALYGSLLVNSAEHRTPMESYERLLTHLKQLHPDQPEALLRKFLG